MAAEFRTVDLTDSLKMEDLVRDLDAILDAWFLGEVAPALDDAKRARPLSETRSPPAAA